ncbi:MAG: hypothetical protein CMJ19_02415 [Phycisphaeraceae bacterium]|nr:hypothetical protein [Phycisphaeraceae bacterium]
MDFFMCDFFQTCFSSHASCSEQMHSQRADALFLSSVRRGIHVDGRRQSMMQSINKRYRPNPTPWLIRGKNRV